MMPKTLEERFAEIRQRVIVDGWDGTGHDAGHWWSCRLCSWIWKDGKPEAHEPGCPMEVKP